MASKSTSTALDLFYEAEDAEQAGNTGQAAEIYQQLIAKQPDFAPAYVNLGKLYFQRHLFNLAANCFFNATEIQPDYCTAHFNFANAIEEMGRYDEAISSYLRAIEIDPRHCDSHFNLALAYQRKGDNPKALHHWLAYLAFSSCDPEGSDVARREIRNMLERHPMRVAFSNDNPARTFDPRPALALVK